MSGKLAARRSLAQGDSLVDEWKSSGQTQSEFARMHGINPKTFHGQVRRARKRKGQTKKNKGASLHFVEVSPNVPVESPHIGGCRITMSRTEIEFASSTDPDWAFQILSKMGHGK